MHPKTPAPVRAVVVDDVDDMRQLLRLLLEREGHFTVVAEADNGQSAVTATLAHRPDLVLLDITMPVMDGMQALRLIRSEVP
jgi:CheY-like chemotaxis protein